MAKGLEIIMKQGLEQNLPIEKITQSLRQELSKTSATEFSLNGVNIGTIGAKAIASIISTNPNIVYIKLTHNSIGLEEAKIIAIAIATSKITSIELSHNIMSDDGIEIFVNTILINCNITYIALDYNNIRDKGAKSIAYFISKHPSISYIDLSNNQIGDNGCIYLANALEKNINITYIELVHNNIDNEGGETISLTIRNHPNIIAATLGYNIVNAQILQEIEKIVDSNKTRLKHAAEFLCNKFNNNNSQSIEKNERFVLKLFQYCQSNEVFQKMLINLGVNNVGEFCAKINHYILNNWWLLAGICKELPPDHLFNNLSLELNWCILGQRSLSLIENQTQPLGESALTQD